MKKSPFRLGSMLLPASFAISALCPNKAEVMGVFTLYSLLLLISCVCPGSFRNASAAEPGVRRVDARFLGSLIITLIASLIMICLSLFSFSRKLFPIVSVITAILLIFEQLFEERMFSIGRPTDANLLALITSILFCGSAFMPLTMYGALISLIISIVITFINQPIKFRKPLFSFQYAPRALLQDLLPASLLIGSVHFLSVEPVFAMIGWMICRGCRTFARCSPDETTKPLFIISLLLLLSAVIPLFNSSCSPSFAIGLAGIICTLIGFNLSRKNLLSVLSFVIICVLSYLGLYPFAAVAACVACVTSFDRHIFLKKV